MNTVSRIQFPNTTDVSDLYIRCHEGATITCRESCREVNLLQGSIVSLNTYFNSFYEKLYAKYTKLCSLYYLLKLEGDFQVSLYREVYGRESRELIYTEKFEKCQITDYVKILLPNISQNENTGRVYLEIACGSKCGLFTGGLIVTEQNKLREVSIGIITCTFKKEAYVTNTVNTILQDELLKNKNFRIYVVDNGRTLKETQFKDKRVTLIPNKNVGGSGGFTRGLIEAIGENVHTHFIFMDDDIELDSETIYRLFSLYEHAENDFAIAGSMLDLRKKHTIYEVGALYNKSNESSGCHPFSVARVKHNLDLKSTTSLNLFLLEETLDYGGFWFFAFSKKVIEKIGLPMPFFIKIDDMEFGLRIKELADAEIVSFPSIAVWHEPFYVKNNSWEYYYTYRNFLITNSIRSSLGYVKTFKHLTKLLVSFLLFFDYNSAEMLIKALEHYMKGPDFIRSSDPEALHSQVLERSKHYKKQGSQCNYYSLEHFYQKKKVGILKKAVSLLTVNGHLLPSFIISNNEALVMFSPNYSGQWHKAFAKKGTIIFREENGSFHRNEINRLAGIKLLGKWFLIALTSSIKWSNISEEWKKAANELVSTEFWQHYLEIKKP